tara:strand:- start:179 stop:1999 length:1821 start_codon:yes stop_codon:yes gene_type:complete
MATTYQDFNQARATLADKVGEIAWQLPVNIVINMLNELLGFGLGTQTAKSGMGGDVGYEAGRNLIPTVPMGEHTQGAVEAITPTIDFLNTPFEAAGNIVEDLTGSKMAGGATEFITGWAGPTAAVKGLSTLKGSRSALGESLGKHVDIDLRPRNDGLSRGIQTVASTVARQDITPSYYGTGRFDRGASKAESAIRGTSSILQSIFNPKADAVMKAHGLTPASIKRIHEYRDLLYRAENPTNWEGSKMPTKSQIAHAEKVMIAELRKAYGLRLKSGKPVSPEMLQIVEQYHPRLVKTDGVPTIEQMREVLGDNIPEQYLIPLIDDMARTMVGDRPNIVAYDGNPSQVAMSGPGKRGTIKGENTTELLTLQKSTYDMMGDAWAHLMAGDRFNPKLKNLREVDWKKPGDKGYDELVRKYPEQGFNEDTLRHFFGVKADMSRKLAIHKKTANPNNYSEGLNINMVDVNGQEFLVYRVVSQSDNPLLANTPATILLNPRTGVSRILQYDELDLTVKALTEAGYPNRFHTVSYGKFIYDDAKLKKAGVGKTFEPEEIEFTPVDRVTREAGIDAAMDVPYTGETSARGFLPVAELTTEQLRKRDEDSQARNIY